LLVNSSLITVIISSASEDETESARRTRSRRAGLRRVRISLSRSAWVVLRNLKLLSTGSSCRPRTIRRPPGDHVASFIYDDGCILAGVSIAHSAMIVYDALHIADGIIEGILQRVPANAYSAVAFRDLLLGVSGVAVDRLRSSIRNLYAGRSRFPFARHVDDSLQLRAQPCDVPSFLYAAGDVV